MKVGIAMVLPDRICSPRPDPSGWHPESEIACWWVARPRCAHWWHVAQVLAIATHGCQFGLKWKKHKRSGWKKCFCPCAWLSLEAMWQATSTWKVYWFIFIKKRGGSLFLQKEFLYFCSCSFLFSTFYSYYLKCVFFISHHIVEDWNIPIALSTNPGPTIFHAQNMNSKYELKVKATQPSLLYNISLDFMFLNLLYRIESHKCSSVSSHFYSSSLFAKTLICRHSPLRLFPAGPQSYMHANV